MQPPATDGPGAPAMRQPSAPPWDGADRFRLSGATYRRAHAVPPAQQQGRRDLAACRTAPRGGHAAPCPTWGCERDASHACRHRHGPQGQTWTKGQWGEDRTAAWRPVPSGHLVCPVPHDLTPLLLAPQRPLLTLLCNAARPPLVPWGPRNLGGQRGCTMVLHPWEQTLGAHAPVHCLMAAGARSANGTRGIDADPRCLLPVRALRPVLRGKCCAALARGGSSAAAPLVAGPPALGTPEDVAPLRAQLYPKAGVVYAKAPRAGPAHVLDSVGRYPQRVALAHHRLLAGRDGGGRFASRHRRPGHRVPTRTRDADALLRRVLLPGLPRGFMRLRPDGCLATRHKARTLRRCRARLGQPSEPPPRSPQRGVQWRQEVTGSDRTPCPPGGASPLVRRPLPPLSPPAASRGMPVEGPIDDAS